MELDKHGELPQPSARQFHTRLTLGLDYTVQSGYTGDMPVYRRYPRVSQPDKLDLLPSLGGGGGGSSREEGKDVILFF